MLKAERQGEVAQLLTRGELAAALNVSVRTVDRMLAEDELPCMKLRGSLVRFYLPDVLRGLAATAGTRKRGPGKMTNEGVRP
ncbi:MAG TPA: excisionase family DNA-binding protein [Candidatus Paceibacterota bacterium]|nr:excisionase family DNA-binding protein [Verrucomicrobiota bacterium]HSA12475.1 excisionase family DNA-binding protein [Candidatus Paceibacterota bacterium]